jgi:hypothetical protein
VNPVAEHLAAVHDTLTFDPLLHRYFVGTMQLSSVTQVLKACGISRDWSDVPLDVLEAKRALGQAAHAAAHYYDDGSLRAETVDDRVTPYLQAWIDFRTQTGFTPSLLETPLHHPGLMFAGTLDRAGCFEKFERCDPRDLYILDIKTGDPDDAGAEWQTAAYAELLSMNLSRHSPFYASVDFRLRPRYSVRLWDDGRYTLAKYPDSLRNWTEFTHFLSTFRRQHAQRHPRRVAA